MRVELELRNLPRFRVMEYLAEAGGESVGEIAAQGMGWSARLEELEPVQVGSLQVPRDRLIIEGDEGAVRGVRDHLEYRTMRGGG